MFINYAHRGASAYAPENTLMAFYLGVMQHADGIETDIQRSKDGVLTLFHDLTLERAAGQPGSIADYTFDELREFRVSTKSGLSDRITSLDEFLSLFAWRDLAFALEIKTVGVEEEVLRMIKNYHMEEKVVITSEWFEAIRRVKAYCPHIRVGHLVWEVNDDVIRQLLDIGGEQLCPHSNLVNRELVDRIHHLGLELRTWGIGDEEQMRKVYNSGADGTTVDFPDKLYEYKQQCGAAD